MLSQVRYLNRLWNVTAEGPGFLLTYAETPPAHLVGRVLFVSAGGVWECSRDGLATPVALMDGDGARPAETVSVLSDDLSVVRTEEHAAVPARLFARIAVG